MRHRSFSVLLRLNVQVYVVWSSLHIAGCIAAVEQRLLALLTVASSALVVVAKIIWPELYYFYSPPKDALCYFIAVYGFITTVVL